MAALAVFLQDRRDIFGERGRVHVSHLRQHTRCRTNCRQQRKNRAIHGFIASMVVALLPIFAAGSGIISRMDDTYFRTQETSRTLTFRYP
jgi:hypothetical protein